MESPNLGSGCFWKAMFIFTIAGVVFASGALVRGIIWIFNHVTIK